MCLVVPLNSHLIVLFIWLISKDNLHIWVKKLCSISISGIVLNLLPFQVLWSQNL
jgi:hypothetical protein